MEVAIVYVSLSLNFLLISNIFLWDELSPSKLTMVYETHLKTYCKLTAVILSKTYANLAICMLVICIETGTVYSAMEWFT